MEIDDLLTDRDERCTRHPEARGTVRSKMRLCQTLPSYVLIWTYWFSPIVRLYGERESPKYERAALRWLARYLEEAEPTLEAVARLASGLARVDGPGGEPALP